MNIPNLKQNSLSLSLSLSLKRMFNHPYLGGPSHLYIFPYYILALHPSPPPPTPPKVLSLLHGLLSLLGRWSIWGGYTSTGGILQDISCSNPIRSSDLPQIYCHFYYQLLCLDFFFFFLGWKNFFIYFNIFVTIYLSIFHIYIYIYKSKTF